MIGGEGDQGWRKEGGGRERCKERGMERESDGGREEEMGKEERRKMGEA